jgi:hypothetical protein
MHTSSAKAPEIFAAQHLQKGPLDFGKIPEVSCRVLLITRILSGVRPQASKLALRLNYRLSLFVGRLSLYNCTAAQNDNHCSNWQEYGSFVHSTIEMPNAALQLRRAISIQPEANRLLEKHAIAPSAARLCYARRWWKSSAP